MSDGQDWTSPNHTGGRWSDANSGEGRWSDANSGEGRWSDANSGPGRWSDPNYAPTNAEGNKLDVTPADLINVSGQYADLQRQAAAIGPQAVEEVNRIIATHGAMGYPVAVGVVMSLARKQARMDTKIAQFGVYSERFAEHAAAYGSQDAAGAAGYQHTQFSV